MNLKDEFQLQLACLELWSGDNDRKPHSDDRCWHAVFYIFLSCTDTCAACGHCASSPTCLVICLTVGLGCTRDSPTFSPSTGEETDFYGVLFSKWSATWQSWRLWSPHLCWHANTHLLPSLSGRHWGFRGAFFFTVILLMRETVSRDQLWSRPSHTKKSIKLHRKAPFYTSRSWKSDDEVSGVAEGSALGVGITSAVWTPNLSKRN